MQISAISLFPEMFDAVSKFGVVGRAIKQKLISLDVINPRDFTQDKHRTVDDRPYGGGPGMLMKVEPLEMAIVDAKTKSQSSNTRVVYLSPQGRRLDHKLIKELSEEEHLVLLCGRYEGVDQRLVDSQIDDEISIGDFVLSGGELASMIVIDSIARQKPGALGHKDSALEDSFEDGLLDHPHYTRPDSYSGSRVPAVLLGGNHLAIENWRLKQRLGRTWLHRPDLLESRDFTKREEKLLSEFQMEHNESE